MGERNRTFYKGYSADNNRRFVAVSYEDPFEDEFGDSCKVVVTHLDDGSRRSFEYTITFDNFASSIREISEDEYNYMLTLIRLQTELFLNQYTGGFPHSTNCISYASYLRKWISKVIEGQTGLDCEPDELNYQQN